MEVAQRLGGGGGGRLNASSSRAGRDKLPTLPPTRPMLPLGAHPGHGLTIHHTQLRGMNNKDVARTVPLSYWVSLCVSDPTYLPHALVSGQKRAHPTGPVPGESGVKLFRFTVNHKSLCLWSMPGVGSVVGGSRQPGQWRCLEGLGVGSTSRAATATTTSLKSLGPPRQTSVNWVVVKKDGAPRPAPYMPCIPPWPRRTDASSHAAQSCSAARSRRRRRSLWPVALGVGRRCVWVPQPTGVLPPSLPRRTSKKQRRKCHCLWMY